MKDKKFANLLTNSRFYVLVNSLLISFLIFFIVRVAISNSQLRYIRLQQVYGLAALLYWYLVLLMSATAKVVGNKPWLPPILFTRRSLGVMVAYFAFLHAAIALWAQLNGWHGLWLLPATFRWSLLLGAASLLVLLIMAALSVDKIIAITKFKYWSIVQKASYIAGVLAIIHVWIIGTHVSYGIIQLIAYEALVILFGVESWRFGRGLVQKKYYVRDAVVAALSVWILLSGGLLIMKLYVVSYSTLHTHAPTIREGSHGH